MSDYIDRSENIDRLYSLILSLVYSQQDKSTGRRISASYCCLDLCIGCLLYRTRRICGPRYHQMPLDLSNRAVILACEYI